MDILGVLVHAFFKVLEVWAGLYMTVMQVLQDGLRVPLRHAGVEGWPQLAIILLVPLLSLIAVVKFLRGFIRVGFVWITGSFLIFVAISLISAIRAT